MNILEFEKPIYVIKDKIEELKKTSMETGLDLQNEIEALTKQAQEYEVELYTTLTPAQKILIARHPKRPTFLDYVSMITEDFIELKGDRFGTDDRAIIGGLAKIDGVSVMLVGTQKGKNTKENLEYNFGMPQPQGYQKALRLFKHASRFNLPIVTLIDTPGAFPGINAEQTGQGTAIATNLREMAKLEVPVVSVITGEGCSGGALGLAVANTVLIFEHAYYTVITPEGCASILYRDTSKASEAAQALKITPEDLLKFNIVDEIIKEPLGGAHYDPAFAAKGLKEAILKHVKLLKNKSPKELKDLRYKKFRNFGKVK